MKEYFSWWENLPDYKQNNLIGKHLRIDLLPSELSLTQIKEIYIEETKTFLISLKLNNIKL